MSYRDLETAELKRRRGVPRNWRTFRYDIEFGVLERISGHLDNSLMLVTALNPHIGCEKAAQISCLLNNSGIVEGRAESSAGEQGGAETFLIGFCSISPDKSPR
jgi:hypothetical protein